VGLLFSRLQFCMCNLSVLRHTNVLFKGVRPNDLPLFLLLSPHAQLSSVDIYDTSIDGNSTFETVVRKRAIAALHSTIYLDAGPSIFGTDLVSLFVLSLSFVSVS